MHAIASESDSPHPEFSDGLVSRRDSDAILVVRVDCFCYIYLSGLCVIFVIFPAPEGRSWKGKMGEVPTIVPPSDVSAGGGGAAHDDSGSLANGSEFSPPCVMGPLLALFSDIPIRKRFALVLDLT